MISMVDEEKKNFTILQQVSVNFTLDGVQRPGKMIACMDYWMAVDFVHSLCYIIVYACLCVYKIVMSLSE